MAYNPTEYNDMQRGADLENPNPAANEIDLLDYTRYGVAGALTSGTVGLINSAKGIYNALGGETSYINEEQAIRESFGKGASDFYLQHKTGVDATGFLLSATLSGAGGLKAFRMAQGAGRFTMGIEAATGISNPAGDIVLGSRAMQVARETAISNPTTFSWNNAQTWNAIAQGFKQNMAEAFAFDAAAGIANANNALINPDRQDYFTSLWNYTKDTAPFTIGFGAFGTLATGLQIRKGLQTAYAEKTLDNTKFTLIGERLPSGGLPGDKLLRGFDALNALTHSEDFAVDATDKFAKARKASAEEQVMTYLSDTFSSLNKAEMEGVQYFDRLVKAVKETPHTLDKLAEEVAGLSGLYHINKLDQARLDTFFTKTISPTIVSFGKNMEDNFNILRAHLKQGFGEDYHGTIDSLVDASYQSFIQHGMETSSGYMHINQEVIKTLKEGADKVAGAHLLEIPTAGNVVTNTTNAYNHFVSTVSEQLKAFDKTLMDAGVLKNSMFGKTTAEEFNTLVSMHEISHFKTNGGAALRSVEYHVANNTEMGKELELFSRHLYPDDWAAFDQAIHAEVSKGADYAKTRRAMYTKVFSNTYALSPAELIAQSAEFMFHPQYMEQAAKIAPKLTNFFNRQGGVMKPWKETVAYKNVRTGEEYTSILPLPQDLGKVVHSGDTVYVEGTRISTQYDPKFFNPAHVDEMYSMKDKYLVSTLDKGYMKAAAMFAAIGKLKPEEFLKSVVGEDGNILLNQYDLPRLEKLVTSFTDETIRADNVSRRVIIDVSKTEIPKLVDMSLDEVRTLLLDNKKSMRFALTSQLEHNEWMISNALNMDVKAAMSTYDEGGVDAGKLLLMGERNYDRPENITAKYVKTTMKELDVRSKSIQNVMERESMLREMRMRASAEVLGDDFKYFPRPESVNQALPNLSEVETRTGMLTQLRAAVGKSGLRDIAQYVGRITRNAKNTASQEIEKSASKYYELFNKPENTALRSELALATNELYKGWYNTFEITAGKEPVRVLMSLENVQKYTSVIEDLYSKAAAGDKVATMELHNIMQGIEGSANMELHEIGIMHALANRGGMTLSKEVHDYFENYVKPFNQQVARNHTLISRGKGMMSTYRSDILYPPPRDLRKFPHVAFVLPHAAIEGVDNGRFMLFGRTARELEVKMAAAKEKYSETHRIVTSDQVAEYKKLVNDYDKNDVFDEWFFDPEITRKGRTAEAIPNLDIQASEVLDRFRDWQHRTSEAQIMSAVELMYAPTIDALNSADKAFSRAANASVLGRNERATIFEDTKNIMLDKSSRMGTYGEMYKSFSSRVSRDGARVIDGIVNSFGTQASSKMTEASFAEMNKKLADAGFNPPHTDMVRAVLASPDASNSRSFELLVRTMNNLVGTFQLSLDMANSILQAIASPILTLPVIREAIQNSADAKNLLTVLNPATKTLEVTPMKAFSKAIAASWTTEGKVLRQQMMERGILTDYLKEYHEAQDFSSLTGRHSIRVVNDKINQLREFGGKWSGHRYAEDFTRFVVAHSMQQIAKARGMTQDETWAMIHNAVDAVHGIYRAHQRAQVFNGVIGQSIGMYQTYFFTWMQNLLKGVADGDRKKLMLQAGMQTSIFGIRSLPGFETLNGMVAATNSGQMDLYSVTNADDPKSWGAWALYGLGSHAFLYPADFASRGDVTIRNNLVLPTQVQDIPSVSILSKVIKNMYDTGSMIANNDASVGQALLFGIAHNGLSRPLQGIGTIASGTVTTSKGTPLFVNANHTDYDINNEMNLGMIATRLIGTRPLNEAIMMDNYYRDRGYQANVKQETADIGKEIRISLTNGGTISTEDWDNFSNRYVQAGGKIEQFNAYVSTMLTAASKSEILDFRQHMEQDDPLSRNVRRMSIEREAVSPTEYE